MWFFKKRKMVKLVASLIYKDEKKRIKAERELKKKIGVLENLEKILPFDFTDYYYEEFGAPLKRKLICFKRLIGIENSEEIKIETIRIENRLRERGNRTVNIDPGYITDAKLILFTTKDYSHRIYIGKNIFAESTLFFKDKTFKAYPWTYPDYASQEMISYFNAVRELDFNVG